MKIFAEGKVGVRKWWHLVEPANQEGEHVLKTG